MNLKALPEKLAPHALFPLAAAAFGEVYVRLVPETPGFVAVSIAQAAGIAASVVLFFTTAVLGWPRIPGVD